MNGQQWLLEKWRRLGDLDRRRPWLLDCAVALLLAVLTIPPAIFGGREGHGGPAGAGHDNPAWVQLLGCVAILIPLVWRRRAPFTAFLAVDAVLIAEWSVGVWVPTASTLLFMLFTVAVRSPLRTVAWAGGLTVASASYALLVELPATEHRLLILLLLVGTASAGVAGGLVVRTRRAYLAALEDRATRLETERDQRARLATAAERARVAREMHDIVGHHVSVIVGLADGGATLASSRGEKAAEPLRLIGDTGRQALAELRRVLGVLRDSGDGLTPQPGLPELDRLLPSMRAAGLTVTYSSSGDLHDLGQGLQLAIYRIVQEALTNSLKHAGPGASVTVTVAEDQGAVHVRVTDSGPALPRPPATTPATAPQNGIVGIRERAGMYGGTVTTGPTTTGWAVDVLLREPA